MNPDNVKYSLEESLFLQLESLKGNENANPLQVCLYCNYNLIMRVFELKLIKIKLFPLPCY